MIVIKFGKWSSKAGNKYVYDRVYDNGKWTPLCKRRIRYNINLPPDKNNIPIIMPEQYAKALWNLLDDIDTGTDMFKPLNTEKSMRDFYTYVKNIIQKRHEILETDGYNLYFPGTLPIKDN